MRTSTRVIGGRGQCASSRRGAGAPRSRATSWRASVELVGARQLALAARVDQRQRVVVAAERRRAEVGDDQRHVLALALLARVARSGRRLSAAKPTQNGALRQRARRAARMSGFSTSVERRHALPCVLLDLVARRRSATRQSATAAVATKTSLRRRRRPSPRRASRARSSTSMRRTPARRRERDRAGDERDVGAGLGGGARDREAHLAARPVGEAAHRIDRLEGRPGGDQHAPAGEHLRLEERDQLVEQLGRPRACGRRRSRRTPGRRCPGRARSRRRRASCATLRWVAGCAHISRFIAGATQQRAALDRPRQAQQARAGRRRGRAAAWR